MAEAESIPWPVTWEAAAEAQRADEFRMTPEQRVEWLEEIVELARLSGALANERARRDEQIMRDWNGA